MRICYVAEAPHIHVRRWLEFFIKQGYDVHCLSDVPGEIEGATVHLIGDREASKWQHYKKAVTDIRRICDDLKPDILHAHFISGYGYWSALANYHPLIITAWGSDLLILPRENLAKRLFTAYAIKKADFLTADSQSLINELYNFKASPDKVEKIVWGIKQERFELNKLVKRVTLPDDFGGSRFIISSRQHRPLYNIDIIIEIFAELSIRFDELRLIITSEGEETENLERKVRRLDIENKVFFTGFIPEEGMPEILSRGCLFLTIPDSDATSVSLLEAMASGLPAIVSDLPANREWVTDGWNGFIISTDSDTGKPDKQVLFNRMFDLLLKPEKRALMGERSREIIENQADYYHEMSMVEEIYKNLAAGRKHKIHANNELTFDLKE